MKFLAIAVCSALLSASSAWTQTLVIDTLDPGRPDTFDLRVVDFQSDMEGSAHFCVELSYSADTGWAVGLSMSYRWDDPNLQLDSVNIAETLLSAFDFVHVAYYMNSRDSSNKYNLITFGGARLHSDGLKLTSTRQTLCRYYFTVYNWDRTAQTSLTEKTFTISGPRRAASVIFPWKKFTFYNFTPQWSGPLVIHDPDRPCCVGRMGDIDGYTGIDIGDQTLLVDYLFSEGTVLDCLDAANVDGSEDGRIDMADLVTLVEYLFLGGELAECE